MNLLNQVFTNKAANGSTIALTSSGRFLTILVQGTFGGGTVAVEISGDGVTWTALTSTAVAAVLNVQVSDSFQVRLTLSGATAPSINAWIGYA